MRDIPVEVLASWPAPNYINPVVRGNATIFINTILLFFVIVIVVLRLYVRLVIKRWFGKDDVFIIVALVPTVVLTALWLVGYKKYHLNRHIYDIPLTNLVAAFKLSMAAKIAFIWATTFTRISLFSLYYRLARDSGKRLFIWAIHINVVYTLSLFIGLNFLAVFLCHPIQNYWNFEGSKTCLNEGTATMVAGVLNMLADIACTITPIPAVAKLHITTRQRVAVIILFSFGFIVITAAAVRTYFVWKSLIAVYDQTWYSIGLYISSAIEIDLGIICACAPALPPLVPLMLGALSRISSPFSSKQDQFTNSSNGHPSERDQNRQMPSQGRDERKWLKQFGFTSTLQSNSRPFIQMEDVERQR